MTEREALIKKFKKGNLDVGLSGNAEWNIYNKNYDFCLNAKSLDALASFMADFIIQDRARIVEPLVKLSIAASQRFVYLTEKDEAIDETLTRAGVEI